MKKILHTFILLFAFTVAQSQTADDKARAYYQEAVKAFDSKNYKRTIDYCKQATDLLKTTNARIELLRIRSYYGLGEYEKAKTSLNTFSTLASQPELKTEALEYLVKVEQAEKAAEEKRLAQQRRLEQERIEKEKKLAQQKLQQEQAEARSYADAMTGKVSAIRQFLRDYPNHQGRQNALDLLDTKEEQAYNNAITKNSVWEYEDYLKVFYDGKHKATVTGLLNKAKEKEAYELASRLKSVNESEAYFMAYPKGENRLAVLSIYEQALNAEGQQAMLAKDYAKAEVLFGKYKSVFPNGSNIKTVQNGYNQAQHKIKKQERVAARNDKTYFMLNYATNESAGIEIGKINNSHKLSVYGTLNYGFRFPIEQYEVVELESVDDYEGDGNLKAGLVTSSFGFNMKITYPLWIYAGGGVKYQVYVDGSSTSYKVAGEDYWQFFPEFGLRTRIGKKISLKAGMQLFNDKPAWQVGIGF